MEAIIQLSAGRGPIECQWVVAKLLGILLQELKLAEIEAKVLSSVKGNENFTVKSATILIGGENISSFKNEWEGSILWIGKSPYRKFHKRKNWFVEVRFFQGLDPQKGNDHEIKYQVFRASGPGGQHVNKTDSAVRAVHVPTGLTSTCQSSRSQIQNRKLAKEKLLAKIAQQNEDEMATQGAALWQSQVSIQRGNPMKSSRRQNSRIG